MEGGAWQLALSELDAAEKLKKPDSKLDFSVTPMRNLNVTGSLTYLDPKYDLFTGGSAFNPATNGVVPTNQTGLRPSGQSEYSLAVGMTYTHPIVNDVKAIFHIDYDYSSAYFIAQGLRFKAQPETLNASIAVEIYKGLEVSIWGRNLTEPKYNPVIFPGVAQSGTLSAYPSPPRFYGGSVRYKF